MPLLEMHAHVLQASPRQQSAPQPENAIIYHNAQDSNTQATLRMHLPMEGLDLRPGRLTGPQFWLGDGGDAHLVSNRSSSLSPRSVRFESDHSKITPFEAAHVPSSIHRPPSPLSPRSRDAEMRRKEANNMVPELWSPGQTPRSSGSMSSRSVTTSPNPSVQSRAAEAAGNVIASPRSLHSARSSHVQRGLQARNSIRRSVGLGNISSFVGGRSVAVQTPSDMVMDFEIAHGQLLPNEERRTLEVPEMFLPTGWLLMTGVSTTLQKLRLRGVHGSSIKVKDVITLLHDRYSTFLRGLAMSLPLILSSSSFLSPALSFSLPPCRGCRRKRKFKSQKCMDC